MDDSYQVDTGLLQAVYYYNSFCQAILLGVMPHISSITCVFFAFVMLFLDCEFCCLLSLSSKLWLFEGQQYQSCHASHSEERLTNDLIAYIKVNPTDN